VRGMSDEAAGRQRAVGSKSNPLYALVAQTDRTRSGRANIIMLGRILYEIIQMQRVKKC
jgi:hypothetical protein